MNLMTPEAIAFVHLGKFKYPAAEAKAPAPGTYFYIPSLAHENYFIALKWVETEVFQQILERRIVHLDQQSAIAHAQALIQAGNGNELEHQAG